MPLATWLLLVALETSPSTRPVYPSGSNGFAAYILGGFFVLGVLVLFMIWTSRKPRSRQRTRV
ncbi:MAG: hypothetical protein ACLGIF_07920 [Actinomycetes bacterium]